MACVDYGHLYALAEPMIVQKRNELLMQGIRSIQSQTGDTVDNRFLKIRKLLDDYDGELYQVKGLMDLLGEIARTLIGLRCPLLDAFTDTVKFNPFRFFEEPRLHDAMVRQIESRSAEEFRLMIQALREHPEISSITETTTFQVLLMQCCPYDNKALTELGALYNAEKRKAEDLESSKKRRR
jgi:hypothetical protein